MEERHLKSAVEILQKMHYINIASVCPDGSPWNTPMSVTCDSELHFHWGSSPENIHSINIRNDSRTFITIYDSTVPEGTGEAIYMSGIAKEMEKENDFMTKYVFAPERVWINDEAKNEDGSFKHDIRVELDMDSLRRANNG